MEFLTISTNIRIDQQFHSRNHRTIMFDNHVRPQHTKFANEYAKNEAKRTTTATTNKSLFCFSRNRMTYIVSTMLRYMSPQFVSLLSNANEITIHHTVADMRVCVSFSLAKQQTTQQQRQQQRQQQQNKKFVAGGCSRSGFSHAI